jgi:cytosine/adenosine deaminase-related metal-dependent hydrolase
VDNAGVVVEECVFATADADGTEYGSGHFVVEGNRIDAVGVGTAPGKHARGSRQIDACGGLATPRLVNCHHLCQWATYGLTGRREEVAL